MTKTELRILGALKLGSFTAEELSKMVSVAQHTVYGAMEDLMKTGLVTREAKRVNRFGRSPYIYTLHACFTEGQK